MKTFKRVAFTLVEVLITLVIIGVIAAITIPSLVNNYQKKQTIDTLKTIDSILQQALKKAEVDYGDRTEWDITNKQEDFINTYIAPYVKIVDIQKNKKYDYYLPNGKKDNNHSNKAMDYYYLTNGSSLAHNVDRGYPNHVFIFLDINGKEKPNRIGRDIFFYQFSAHQGLIPNALASKLNAAQQRTNIKNSSCNRNGSGLYCFALIVLDNWQISKDYPW